MRRKRRRFRFFRWAGALLCVLLLLGLSAWIYRLEILRVLVQTSIGHTMGVPVEIERITYETSNRTFRITNLRARNPEGFGPDLLAEIPEITGVYDPLPLLQARIRLPELDVHMRRMVVVKNEKGELNVDVLKMVQKEIAEGKRKGALVKPLKVDLLTLTVESVVLKTLRAGKPPKVKTFNPKLKKKRYRNLKSESRVIMTVITGAMVEADIKLAVILGVSAATGGVGAVPLLAGAIVFGKSSASAEYEVPADLAYEAAFNGLAEIGKVTAQYPEKLHLKGRVSACDIKIKVDPKKKDKGVVRVTVVARRLALPKPGIAGGVLYEIDRKLQERMTAPSIR